MNLLAIETSTQHLSVALLREGTCLVRSACVAGGGSERLLPWVQELLDEAGMTRSALQGIAFGAGPGSFTGLRLACGIAQGLAYGLSLPVLAVSTLEALAWNTARAHPQAEQIFTCLDARMNEVYCAAYRMQDGVPECVRAPWVAAPEQLDISMLEGVWWGSGDGLATYPALLADGLQARFTTLIPGAVAVAHLAAPRLLRGEGSSAEHAAPLYVRDKVALTTAERLARGGAK